MSVCQKHPELGGERNAKGMCVLCQREYYRKWAAIHRPNGSYQALSEESRKKKAEKNAAKYLENKDEFLKRHVAWAKSNKEKVRAIDCAYKTKNRAKLNALRNRHAKEKPEIAARQAAKRRAACSAATPAWGDNFFLEEAYLLAKKREAVCGGKWHVDHIVPLISKQVCGLHVYTNIQVIRAEINRSKGNRYAL